AAWAITLPVQPLPARRFAGGKDRSAVPRPAEPRGWIGPRHRTARPGRAGALAATCAGKWGHGGAWLRARGVGPARRGNGDDSQQPGLSRAGASARWHDHCGCVAAFAQHAASNRAVPLSVAGPGNRGILRPNAIPRGPARDGPTRGRGPAYRQTCGPYLPTW